MSSTVVKTYDSSQVSVSIGTILVPDFVSISIEQEEDNWAFTTGSSGETSRSRNVASLTTVTLTLQQTNDVNTFLSAAHETATLQNILIKDNNGASLCSIPQGTIVKPATKTYGATEVNDSEWMIKGPAAVNVNGGNN